MAKPQQMGLRWRALRFVKTGESRIAAARRSGVSISRVVKWPQRPEATGSLKPGKLGGHVKPRIHGGRRDCLPQQIAAGGHVNLQGLADGQAARALKVDDRTV